MLYYANVTVHVLAAMLWLGGMFFLAVVGAPVLRQIDSAALRGQLFRQLGERFRSTGWAAIGVLLVTGVLNLHYRGVLGSLMEPSLWSSRYGEALAWKLAAVTVMVVVSALHDFVFGPLASRLPTGSAEALKARLQATWLARVNSLVGVVLVVAAVRLARGG
ncbi:MAG: DUF4149 domain-containing protein [Gemmatimonadota bacterium]